MAHTSHSMSDGMDMTSHSDHSMDMTSHSDHSMGMDMAEDTMDQFCTGDGRVMLPGFQAATGSMSPCILFLFEGANVDTATKYAFAAIGAFLMGFTNEMIRYGRSRWAKDDVSLGADIMRTIAFACQIFLAYMLMLLVMLYEYVMLIMIILGLAVGHMVTLRLSASQRRSELLHKGTKTPPELVGSSGAPCCNTDTVA